MKQKDISTAEHDQTAKRIELEETFARLTMVLEDAATLATDGQASGQSTAIQMDRARQIHIQLILASSLIKQITSEAGSGDD